MVVVCLYYQVFNEDAVWVGVVLGGVVCKERG